MRYLLKSLEISPYNVDALFNLGYVYEQTGNPNLALKTYRNVLKYQPDSMDILFRIATVYQHQGKCREAREYYSFIIQNKPQLSDKINKLIAECR